MFKPISGFFIMLLLNTVCISQEVNKVKLNLLIKKAEQTHSEAVIIYKNNKPVTEKYFGLGQANKIIESMSCTKSLVGLSIACMLTDKLLDSLDVPVYHYFPEWRQGQKQLITIRHLLNMTSGIQNNPNASVEIYPSPDFIKLALAAELATKPGEVWSYNNKSLNLMAGVIRQITGKRMDLYIAERLFKPLGIIDFNWTLDDAGNPHVMSGCQVKATDFVKIGLLLLNKGKYNNREVISEKYINEILSPCKQYAGYGMLWWIDYEKAISTIDDEIISELTKAGISNEFIQKVSQMKGEYYSNEEYYAKIQIVFGNNPWEYIDSTLVPKNLRLRKKEFRGNITYRADGYLGNYIIVDPKNNIVAIRMISSESFHDQNDNFREFENLILDLTK